MSARAFVKRTAAVVLLSGLGLIVSVPAYADSTPTPRPRLERTPSAATISTVQQKCESAISRRLTVLGKDVARINDAKDLTASDKSALLAIANSDTSGLTSLKSTIQSDTTGTQLAADCKRIVSDYRIYELFEPQVHLVISADRILATVTKLQTVITKVQTAVANSSASAAVKQQVTDKLNEISSKLQAAQAAASGVPAELLALTPSGYPGYESTLKSARSSLETARKDLEGLRGDLRDLRNILKSDRSRHAPAHPSPSAS